MIRFQVPSPPVLFSSGYLRQELGVVLVSNGSVANDIFTFVPNLNKLLWCGVGAGAIIRSQFSQVTMTAISVGGTSVRPGPGIIVFVNTSNPQHMDTRWATGKGVKVWSVLELHFALIVYPCMYHPSYLVVSTDILSSLYLTWSRKQQTSQVLLWK